MEHGITQSGIDAANQMFVEWYSQEAIERIEEKYNVNIEPVSIKLHYLSSNPFERRLVCRLKDDPAVLFNVSYDIQTEELRDDLLLRKVGCLAGKLIVKSLQSIGVSCVQKTVVSGIKSFENVQISAFEEVVSTNKALVISSDIIVKEEEKSADLYKKMEVLFQKFCELDESITVGATIWVFPEERYDRALKESVLSPSISLTVLNHLQPSECCNIAYKNNKVFVGKGFFSK